MTLLQDESFIWRTSPYMQDAGARLHHYRIIIHGVRSSGARHGSDTAREERRCTVSETSETRSPIIRTSEQKTQVLGASPAPSRPPPFVTAAFALPLVPRDNLRAGWMTRDLFPISRLPSPGEDRTPSVATRSSDGRARQAGRLDLRRNFERKTG